MLNEALTSQAIESSISDDSVPLRLCDLSFRCSLAIVVACDAPVGHSTGVGSSTTLRS